MCVISLHQAGNLVSKLANANTIVKVPPVLLSVRQYAAIVLSEILPPKATSSNFKLLLLE